MKAEDWQHVEAILQAALDRALDKRAAFLDEACADDLELRREVESLLSAYEESGDFMEEHLSQVAADLMADGAAGAATAGELVGSYKILSSLGAGGMAEVYLAEDMKLGRKIALKMLPADFSRDIVRLHRFEQEARLASNLSHPNICVVHEVSETEDGRHFIVMEYVDGVTLRHYMTGRQIELSDALDIVIQIASALAVAHEAGIVHRDIKPENIMVRRDGYVKVLDFGIAKLTETEQTVTHAVGAGRASVLTEKGVVLGTDRYMSPEQARGISVDERTDIWSLGVVLYEMVAGVSPFEGETPSDCIASILKTEPPPPSTLAPDTPPELEGLIGKALSKDCGERYQTAAEMLSDLKAVKQEWDARARLERSAPPRAVGFAPATSSAEYIVAGIRRHKLGVLVALSLLAFAAAGVASYFYHAGGDSLAVMPFAYASTDPNVMADPDREYLSDGITDSIIDNLSQAANLKVIARTSVFRYKGKEIDPQRVGQELGVRTILTGRIMQRGDELSISVELVDAANNKHIWGEQFERRLSGLAAVPQDIAKEISDNLRVRLTGADERRVTKHYTENAEAYQLYLQGLYFRMKYDQPNLKKSIGYFERAIAIDHGFALAYAGMADSYSLLGPVNYGGLPPEEAYSQAKAAATKALELDATLAEAHASLGLVKANYDWDFAGAEREFRQAIELNPNYVLAHTRYALCVLSPLGRHAEALQELKRAQELNPLSLLTQVQIGWALYNARRYDEAIKQLRAVLEMEPDNGSARYYLALACLRKGMYDEAITNHRWVIERAGYQGETDDQGDLGYALAVSGRRDEAQKMLEQLLGYARQHYVSSYGIAEVYLGLGDKEQALAWLEKAFGEREDSLLALSTDAKWDSLRSDPRFVELLRRTGLP